MSGERVRSCIVIEEAKSVRIVSEPIPQLEDTSIVLRSVMTGISSGTERMWFLGESPAIVSGRRSYPYYPGYECVGRVVEVGSSLMSEVGVGDRVFAMAPHASHAIVSIGDYWSILPPGVRDEDALGISLTATSLHAVHRARMMAGATVGVIGLGVLGMLLIQVLRACGAGTIIAIGRSEWKRMLAQELGADVALDAMDPNLLVAVHSYSRNRRGVDIVFESAGKPEAVQVATSLARSQGKVVIVGFHTVPLPISGEDLFSRELTVYGVRSAGSTLPESEYVRWNRRANFELARELVCSGRVVAHPLVTHRFQADRIRDAYDFISSGSPDYLQVVLDWPETTP